MSLTETATGQQINYKFLYNVLPDPIIIVDKSGIVVDYNISAFDVFGELKKENKIDDYFADKRKVKITLIELMQYHKVVVDTAILKTRISNIHPFEFKATILSEVNELFLFQFADINNKNELLKYEVEHSFISEINSLKPYLNKTGKELVEKMNHSNSVSTVLKKCSVSKSRESAMENVFMAKLSERIPFYSYNELQIAYLLTIGAGIQQIARIADKSENSVRVMIHRMGNKLNVNSTKDLIKAFVEIVKSEDE